MYQRSILWDPSFIQTEGGKRDRKSADSLNTFSGYSSMPRLFTEQPFVSFFSDRWSDFIWVRNPTERSTRDQKLLKKEERNRCFLRSENKEIVNIFQDNYVFTKYRLNSSYFIRSGDVIRFRRMNWIWEQGDTRYATIFLSQKERFQEMGRFLFTLSITEAGS
ncbi:hypothetical protein HID58_094192, partial [Brassica napus]